MNTNRYVMEGYNFNMDERKFSILSTDEEIGELVAEGRDDYVMFNSPGMLSFEGVDPESREHCEAWEKHIEEMEREDFEALRSKRKDLQDQVKEGCEEYKRLAEKQEVFHLAEHEMENPEAEYYEDEESHLETGWYWWWCFPGCLPDSEPFGPFENNTEARNDAKREASESVEWPDIDWCDMEEYAKVNDLDFPESD